MRSGERLGNASINSAAAPDTIGAAPDVPPKAVSPSPVPASADSDAPGAPISGLMCCVLYAGPREELLAMLPIRLMALAGDIVTLTAWLALRRDLMLFDSTCWMTSVGAKSSPPP